MIDWKNRTIEYEQLRTYAKQLPDFSSAVDWLYAIGVLPNDVTYLPGEDIKTSLDPVQIKCGYLAALAFSWDQDGPSSPQDFVDSLEFELIGSEKKEIAAQALLELGRPEPVSESSPLDAALIDSQERDQFYQQASPDDWDHYGVS